jgi:hypothetical protein
MEETVTRLVKESQEKYYGKFRGFVNDNKDPQQRGRLKVTVPSVMGDEVLAWALPCFPFGGLNNQGLFMVPEANAQVWVEFEEGDLNRPIWTGTFWQAQSDVSQECAKQQPTTRLLKTPGGHLLQFDDEPDNEKIILKHPKGSLLQIDPQGIITIQDSGNNVVILDANAGEIKIEDANGNQVYLKAAGITVKDANSNSIELTASGIKVKGQQIVLSGTKVMLGGEGGEPIIKGQSFLTLFATHIHTASPTGGPTSPPVPQGEMSTLSMKVMTS